MDAPLEGREKTQGNGSEGEKTGEVKWIDLKVQQAAFEM